MDLLALGFKALHRRADIQRTMQLLTPAWEALRKELPELVPLVSSLIKDFAPDLAAVAPEYDVFWLQRSLNTLGAKLKIDGDYGPATKAAVAEFQKKHGLKADGWAGPKETMPAIVNELARHN